MKLFSCHFPGHWIGGHAFILAPTEGDARKLLEAKLSKHGLDMDGLVEGKRKRSPNVDYTIVLVDEDLSDSRVIDFASGDY